RARISLKLRSVNPFTLWRLYLKWSVVTLGILFIVGLTSQPLVSQVERPVCYIEEADGSFRDLSALCGAQTTRDVRRSPEELFFASFQQQVQQYPQSVRSSLANYPQESALASGNWICQTLRRGGESAVAIRRQALAERDQSTSNLARQEILHTTARQHLCP
ncbi:MAG: hypothetical protein F6K11_33705, partial [Leptolyngbya sp. SIO3F4]|nr:hypothetical protein [Leptolyngbya sp. SIO3F4]